MTPNRNRSVHFQNGNEDYIESIRLFDKEKDKKEPFNKTVNRVIEEHKEKHNNGNN